MRNDESVLGPGGHGAIHSHLVSWEEDEEVMFGQQSGIITDLLSSAAIQRPESKRSEHFSVSFAKSSSAGLVSGLF